MKEKHKFIYMEIEKYSLKCKCNILLSAFCFKIIFFRDFLRFLSILKSSSQNSLLLLQSHPHHHHHLTQ